MTVYVQLACRQQLPSFDPVSATRAQLAAWYVATIGYDPFTDDPEIPESQVRQTVREYLDESPDSLYEDRIPAWPLPRPGCWTPWTGASPGEEGTINSLAAHKFLRETGYLSRPGGPEVVNVRIYHATGADRWNAAGDHPESCRYSDFTFRLTESLHA